MTERFLDINIKDQVLGALGRLGEIQPKPSQEARAQKDVPKYEGSIEAILRGVLTRIIFARNYRELGQALEQTAQKVKDGGLDASAMDQLTGRVLDATTRLGDENDRNLAETLTLLFKQNKYVEAANVLKEQVERKDAGVDSAEKKALVDFLGLVKEKGKTKDSDLETMVKRFTEEIHPKGVETVKNIVERSDELQLLLLEEQRKLMMDTSPTQIKEVKLKVKVDDRKRGAVSREIKNLNMDAKDKEFVLRLMGSTKLYGASQRGGSREREWNFESMKPYDVKLVWLRSTGILGKNEKALAGNSETRGFLESMRDAAREVMLNVNEQAKVGEAETQRERVEMRGRRRSRSGAGLRFFHDYADAEGRVGVDSMMQLEMDELLERGMDPGEMIPGRTEQALQQLIESKPDLKEKLIQKGRLWKWEGSPEEFFDLCREEIYEIQGQLTQENMGNLIFEPSAQVYLALMRVDAGEKLELEDVKDAITKMLYIDFAIKNMWKSGANVETWQRVASIMTRERDASFFEIMGIGENLKIQDKDGNWLGLGRFNVDDIMSLADTKVGEQKRYWATELAAQSSALKEKKTTDFVKALAGRILDNQELAGKKSHSEVLKEKEKIQNGTYKFDEKQMRWVVKYLQFLDNATLRSGERGINQSVVPGKMELVDNPLGEFAVKTGPWAVIYLYHYEVTKYGGDFIGNVFLPNVSMLSYARGETLGHFIKKDSRVEAGMMAPDGTYHETGVGAQEFFFGGRKYDATYKDGKQIYEKDGKTTQTEAGLFAEFWSDVIFDEKTGDLSKTAIHRGVDGIRSKGEVKLEKWEKEGKLGFIEHLDFSNMEILLAKKLRVSGFRVPGESNREKFEWLIKNFDYRFWRYDILKAKREGDWINKYVPKKYVETATLFQDFLNAPGLATKVAVMNKIGEYAGGSGMSEWDKQAQKAIDLNNKWSWKGWETTPGSSGKAKWSEEMGSGKDADDIYSVAKEKHVATEGWHPGSGLAHSVQEAKEGFRNPMYFEKQEINNAFYNGLLSREDWGKRKREWMVKAYLGSKYEIGKLKFRLGYIPFLTPFFLFRGWWVDRLGLDWDAFKLVFAKNNEETWAKLKKIIGLG